MNIGNVESNNDEDRFEGFESKYNRTRFIRGVYGIMFAMLLLTALQAGFVYLNLELTLFFVEHMFIFFIGLIFYVIGTIMMCAQTVRKIFPYNLILLFFLVEGMTVMVIYTVIRYEFTLVIMAFIYTGGICGIITLAAIVCPIDLTKCGFLIMVLSIATIAFTVTILITSLFFYDKLLMTIYSYVIVFVTCFYLAYDTQLIIGGKNQELSPDEYVLGACVLYVDIVIIFIYILNIQNS